jgi:hypothetical protein
MSETENRIAEANTAPTDPADPVAPPPPPAPRGAEGPQMSTPETLANIFFEPGRTFEALRPRPRFLVAALIAAAAFMAFYWLYLTRVGYENVVNAEIGLAAEKQDMTAEQRERGRNIQLMPVVKAIRYGVPALVFVVVFAAGGAIYLFGSMAVGKKISYKQALSVWTYSSLPPTLLMALLNVVLLFIRPPAEDSEVVRGLGGLVRANLGILTDPEASPLLTTLLGSVDLFSLYGLFLAALGLRKVARMSAGAAWAVALAPWLIGVLFRILISSFTKTAM